MVDRTPGLVYARADMPPPPERVRGTWLFPLACLALAWVFYRSALHYPFIQDDFNVLGRAQVRGWADLIRLLTAQVPFYRPVSTTLYFALGHALWGANPRPFHAVNVLVAVANACLVAALGTRLFRRRTAGYAAGLIFLTTCGHLLAIYWICVMTQAALTFWFLAAWVCDRYAWETGARGWRVAASVAFGFCVFSNVTGFTLAPVLSASAWLAAPRPGWKRIARAHWPLYAWGVLWLVLQFGVLGWPDLRNYEAGWGGGDVGPLLVLLNFVVYALSPLYAVMTNTPVGGWTACLGGLALLAAFAGWQVHRCRRAGDLAADEPRVLLGLIGLFVYGLAPYLVLRDHFAPYHVGIAAVGASLLVGWLFTRRLPRGVTVLLLAGWLSASLVAVRTYETRERETKGIGWKAELSRNIVADFGGVLASYPRADRVVILDWTEHLLWFFPLGHIEDTIYHRPDVQVVLPLRPEDAAPGPRTVILRYANRHLELVRPPTSR